MQNIFDSIDGRRFGTRITLLCTGRVLSANPEGSDRPTGAPGSCFFLLVIRRQRVSGARTTRCLRGGLEARKPRAVGPGRAVRWGGGQVKGDAREREKIESRRANRPAANRTTGGGQQTDRLATAPAASATHVHQTTAAVAATTDDRRVSVSCSLTVAAFVC